MAIENYVMLAGIALVGYTIYKTDKVATNIKDGVNSVVDRFVTTGPGVRLSEDAAIRKQQMVDAGFLKVNDDGSTTITPAGEAYIEEQRRKEVGAPVNNVEYDFYN